MRTPAFGNHDGTQLGGAEGKKCPPLRRYQRLLTTISILCASCVLVDVRAQQKEDALLKDFSSPPESAWPRVWWHWMNGNITKEGIKLDLEWMHRVGIGGFQNFDASLSTPQVVEKRLAYMTPEWKDAFRYAVTLGDQLGMEEAIASSPGWSETGGPWVPPSQGMKKYVWSETIVEGGQPFKGAPAHPPANTGPFQNYVDRGAPPTGKDFGASSILRRNRGGRVSQAAGGCAGRVAPS